MFLIKKFGLFRDFLSAKAMKICIMSRVFDAFATRSVRIPIRGLIAIFIVFCILRGPALYALLTLLR